MNFEYITLGLPNILLDFRIAKECILEGKMYQRMYRISGYTGREMYQTEIERLDT